MHVFNGTVEDLLSMLGGDPHMGMDPRAETQMIGNDPTFDDFKRFAVQYVQEHDELPEDHQTLQQIMNSSSIDDIETFLRHNHDYCDDCMLKLFRKYAAGREEPEGACPCGGE